MKQPFKKLRHQIGILFGLTLLFSTSIHAGVVGSRTITFTNYCDTPVWFGFISGAAPKLNPAYPGDYSCTTNSDCVAGASCATLGSNLRCFWTAPAPADNNYQLSAQGGTQTVSIPVYSGASVIWSGAIAGRTNCSATRCETADCGGGTGACPLGRGFSQPATQAEFTLGALSTDFYDVEAL